MARWAVFDVDGTLIPNTSVEQLFLKELLQKQALTISQLGTFLLFAISAVLNRQRNPLRSNKGYYRGMPVGSARRFAAYFTRQQLISRISPRGVAEIERRKQKGYHIFLLSGAPQFLIEPLATYLQADFVLGTQLEHHRGYFTGKLAAPHPFGPQKTKYLQTLASELNIHFQESAVFANHHTDALHMALFGEAIAVNPTPQLAQTAQTYHWAIVHW